jgi:hypothetical protein
MIRSWFSEKKHSPKCMLVEDIQFTACSEDREKNYLIFTCNKQIFQTVQDQLEGYASRGIGRKIITEQADTIVTGREPLRAQFPEYFYEVKIEKNGPKGKVKILGTNLALQSAIEALIYGHVFTSDGFRKLPIALYEYAKDIEGNRVSPPKMF